MRIIRINAQKVGSTSESVMKQYLQPRESGYLSSSDNENPGAASCSKQLHQVALADATAQCPASRLSCSNDALKLQHGIWLWIFDVLREQIVIGFLDARVSMLKW